MKNKVFDRIAYPCGLLFAQNLVQQMGLPVFPLFFRRKRQSGGYDFASGIRFLAHTSQGAMKIGKVAPEYPRGIRRNVVKKIRCVDLFFEHILDKDF